MIFLFDLDQTLINSVSAKKYRDNKNWKKVYELIYDGSICEYDGINECLKMINILGHKIGIVTSAPETYTKRIIEKFKWSINCTVCYHDTKNKKPHPEPIFSALKKLNCYDYDKKNIFFLGDSAIDIKTAKNAGVVSVACLWGSENKDEIINEKPDFILREVKEIYEKFLKTNY